MLLNNLYMMNRMPKINCNIYRVKMRYDELLPKLNSKINHKLKINSLPV